MQDLWKYFSTTQTKPFKGKHRSDINAHIFKLAVCSVSMRRMSQLVGVSKRTVGRRIEYLATQARREHSKSALNRMVQDVVAENTGSSPDDIPGPGLRAIAGGRKKQGNDSYTGAPAPPVPRTKSRCRTGPCRSQPPLKHLL